MFESRTAFSLHIEGIVAEHDCSYTDALLYYAELTGAEYADMASMMSQCLIEKVKIEAQTNFHLPKDTTIVISDD